MVNLPVRSCTMCFGLVRNVSRDRRIGHYQNITGYLATTRSVNRVQRRLVFLELSCLEDLYRIDGRDQQNYRRTSQIKWTLSASALREHIVMG
jgi:hypothetical protein